MQERINRWLQTWMAAQHVAKMLLDWTRSMLSAHQLVCMFLERARTTTLHELNTSLQVLQLCIASIKTELTAIEMTLWNNAMWVEQNLAVMLSKNLQLICLGHFQNEAYPCNWRAYTSCSAYCEGRNSNNATPVAWGANALWGLADILQTHNLKHMCALEG